MIKTPIKQIYLLLIVIIGIVSLSVYSTYALFTYEKETDDIVKITTLSTLSINTNTKEYKRIIVKGNSLTTVDIDLTNSFDELLCYGIWYHVVESNPFVYVYKANDSSLTSGSLEGLSSVRVSIVIFNDSKEDASVNIGVNNANDLLCSLNLDDSKHLITEIYKTTYLNDYLLERVNNKELEKESEYKEIDDYLIENNNIDKLFVSSNFEFDNGIFTLLEPHYININNIKEEAYYFILNDNDREMYKINSIDDKYINTTKYIGFIDSINGIVKYEDNYEYYGANPDNYICFYEKDNECELYRVIGLFKDNDKYNIKIIKNSYLGKEKYSITDNNLTTNEDSNNVYNELNKFYEDLPNNSKKQIIEHEYIIDYNNELDNELIDIYKYKSENTYKLNVGLLSISDYLYASNCNNKVLGDYNLDCDKNNWLYKYEDEMLINRLDTNNESIFFIGDSYITRYDTILNYRPVLYLNSDIMLIKGDGTINNPFIIR